MENSKSPLSIDSGNINILYTNGIQSTKFGSLIDRIVSINYFLFNICLHKLYLKGVQEIICKKIKHILFFYGYADNLLINAPPNSIKRLSERNKICGCLHFLCSNFCLLYRVCQNKSICEPIL